MTSETESKRTAASSQESPRDSALTEDAALALLQRNDLSALEFEQLNKSGSAMKSRKVKLGMVTHPRTPRHISLPILRHLFTFELMQVALLPLTLADVKRAAEEVLLNRIEKISLGERLSLARRASARVAAALLLDSESRVIEAALENSHLTEASIIPAVQRQETSAALIHSICHHSKWSLRREIRLALLRNKNTPLARALEFARGLPAPMLQEVLHMSALPANIKSHLLKELQERSEASAETPAESKPD